MTEERPQFPEQIETERLIIRCPRAGDGAEVNAAIRETFADLNYWVEWASYIPEVEETEARCASRESEMRTGEDFTVHARLKSTGALVLCAGLHPRDWQVPKFEIGYWCRAGYQGNGYVTETVRALTQIGFEHFHANRIEIRCDARNARSKAVAERAGYRLEAMLRNECVAPDGQLRDTLVFALLPAEYAQQTT